ncbi:uncharacterized protein LOC144872257 [Branchiostoma floridae x Branchiostoma japonicum]
MALYTFFWAVEQGDVQTVRKALEGLDAGVHINTKRKLDGQTSLHVASRNGRTEVAELLIKNGANLEARDKNQNTPLHLAAAEGHIGTCEHLIRSGADVQSIAKPISQLL